MGAMSESASPRTGTKSRMSSASAAASREARSTLKSLGELPGALVGMVREARSSTDHVVDAISGSSAAYEAAVQASLVAVRQRMLQDGVGEQERARLEQREGELLDRLHQVGRENSAESRGAHQDLLTTTLGGVAGIVAIGAVAVGNKELLEGAVKAAVKAAPRVLKA